MLEQVHIPYIEINSTCVKYLMWIFYVVRAFR